MHFERNSFKSFLHVEIFIINDTVSILEIVLYLNLKFEKKYERLYNNREMRI